jgi:hypothetical protein
MLGFASQKALEDLYTRVAGLALRLQELETDWKAQVAALENAADLYNRAAARAERSKPAGGPRESVGAGSLEEIRRRRGGI